MQSSFCQMVRLSCFSEVQSEAAARLTETVADEVAVTQEIGIGL